MGKPTSESLPVAQDDILVELDAEGIRDLLGDLAAAEVLVAPFHLRHRVGQLWTEPLGPWRPHRLEL
jgi:hypothetical protein